MTIFVGDWATMNKYLPYENDLKLFVDLPYTFYTGRDADFVCVKHGDNLYYGTNYVNAVNELNAKAPQILALNTGDDWVLVDYYAAPTVFMNCTKEIATGARSIVPIRVNSSQMIAFSSKGAAFKVSQSKATMLYMLSEAVLYSAVPDAQMTEFGKSLFVDVYEDNGFSLGYLQPGDVIKHLKPESKVELFNAQTSDFVRQTRKNLSKKKLTMTAARNNPGKKKGGTLTTVPLENLTDASGRFLFSKLLNFIPSVGDSQEIILDMDVSEYGIISAKLLPGAKFSFNIKTDSLHPVEERMAKITEMLGHDKFTVTAFL